MNREQDKNSESINANGVVYVGNFIMGERRGHGTCVFANGDKWEGDWLRDSLDMNGDGTLSLVDGKVLRYRKKS